MCCCSCDVITTSLAITRAEQVLWSPPCVPVCLSLCPQENTRGTHYGICNVDDDLRRSVLLSDTSLICLNFYRATRMHSADYTVARCLSVCPSVCLCARPSHAGIVCKRLHISSIFFHHRVAPPFQCFPYQTGYSDGNSPNGGAECKGVRKNHDLRYIGLYLGNDAR